MENSNTMKTKKDYSIGIIPVHKKSSGEIYICLVLHTTGHWAFPKGHRENNETEKDTALRELKEETGIKDILLEDKTFNEYYSFEMDGIKYDKTVKYFLGYTSNMHALIPEKFKNEISDLAWLPYKEAIHRSTYPETKETIEQALNYIRIKN